MRLGGLLFAFSLAASAAHAAPLEASLPSEFRDFRRVHRTPSRAMWMSSAGAKELPATLDFLRLDDSWDARVRSDERLAAAFRDAYVQVLRSRRVEVVRVDIRKDGVLPDFLELEYEAALPGGQRYRGRSWVGPHQGGTLSIEFWTSLKQEALIWPSVRSSLQAWTGGSRSVMLPDRLGGASAHAEEGGSHTWGSKWLPEEAPELSSLAPGSAESVMDWLAPCFQLPSQLACAADFLYGLAVDGIGGDASLVKDVAVTGARLSFEMSPVVVGARLVDWFGRVLRSKEEQKKSLDLARKMGAAAVDAAKVLSRLATDTQYRLEIARKLFDGLVSAGLEALKLGKQELEELRIKIASMSCPEARAFLCRIVGQVSYEVGLPLVLAATGVGAAAGGAKVGVTLTKLAAKSVKAAEALDKIKGLLKGLTKAADVAVPVERVLANAQLGEAARMAKAAETLGLPKLSEAQAKALKEAHEIGMEREGSGVFEYTQEEIAAKYRRLREHFDEEQSRKLMEEGLAGRPPVPTTALKTPSTEGFLSETESGRLLRKALGDGKLTKVCTYNGAQVFLITEDVMKKLKGPCEAVPPLDHGRHEGGIHLEFVDTKGFQSYSLGAQPDSWRDNGVRNNPCGTRRR
jgi:hypothetical protein